VRDSGPDSLCTNAFSDFSPPLRARRLQGDREGGSKGGEELGARMQAGTRRTQARDWEPRKAQLANSLRLGS